MVPSEQAARARGTQDVTTRTAGDVPSPSSWNRRVPIVLLAAVDFVLASYMALYQWRLIDSVWDPVFGSGQSHLVLDSAVSEAVRRVLLIPDAALGAAAYLAELVLGLVGSQQRWRQRPRLVVIFGANTLAVAFTGVVLVVLQATVVEAWCLVCIVTAVLSMTMLVLALPEVGASWRYLRAGSQCSRGDA